MNVYPAYSVIERNGVVAIVVKWIGNSIAEIMVEDGKFGVAFRNYQFSDILLWRVIG